MMVLYPRSSGLLSFHLILMTLLFRYQHAMSPETPTDAIQHLSQMAECELPVYCWERHGEGMCCYDCSNCTNMVCSGHEQCCANTPLDELMAFVNGDFEVYSGSAYYDYDYDSDELSDSVQPECKKLFTKTNSQRSGPASEPVSYMMFATCPSDASQSQKKLCSRNNERPVINHIPMLDSKSRMFPNVHCLKCNKGPDAQGQPLNLALTRRPQHYYDPFMSLKIEIKSNFFDFDITSIQTMDTLILSVTPRFPDSKRHLIPCDQADNMTECNNPTIHTSYKTACEIFDSSYITGIGIKVKDTATNQTYIAKNIACAYCALGDRMVIADVASNGMKRCRLEHQAEPWLLMNPLLLTDDIDTADGILSVTLKGSSNGTGSCTLGHFYDKVTTTCKKILCPRHHFIHQGKCHPTFTYSVGQSYYIKVRVPTQQDDDDFYKQFGPAVVDAILQESNLVPCDMKGTLRYDSNNNVMAVIFEIFFTGPDGMFYQDVFDRIQPLFRLHNLAFTFNGLEYEIYTADDAVFSKDEPGRLMNYDTNDLSELRAKTNTEWRFNKTRHCHKPIFLTAMEFCFRMYLNVSDKLATLHEDYKERIDADTVAVCIEKYDQIAEYDGDQSDDGVNSGDNSGEGKYNSGEGGNNSGEGEDNSGEGEDNSGEGGNNSGEGGNSSGEGKDNSGEGGNNSGEGGNNSGEGKDNSGEGEDNPKDDDRPTDTDTNVKPKTNDLPEPEGGPGANFMVVGIAVGVVAAFFILMLVCRIKSHNEDDVDEVEDGKKIEQTSG